MKKLVAKVKFPDTVNFNSNPFSVTSGSASTNKLYNFITDIENLEVGDTVVVDTVNGLRLANFVEYSHESHEFGETFSNKTPRWILQKVDLESHKSRVAAAEKAELLKKKMELRRKKAQEMEIYAILAKEDPEMAALLNEFKQLQEVL